jgi:hypothetical protein
MASITKNLRDATIVLKTSGGAQSITLACEEGDLSFTIQDPIRRIMDRGALSHARAGDEAPVEGSMTLKFREFIKQAGDADATPYEFLMQVGTAAGYTGTLAAASGGNEVYCVEMEVTVADPITANSDELIEFAYLHAESVEFSEGDEYNTLRFTFVDWETAPSFSKV